MNNIYIVMIKNIKYLPLDNELLRGISRIFNFVRRHFWQMFLKRSDCVLCRVNGIKKPPEPAIRKVDLRDVTDV